MINKYKRSIFSAVGAGLALAFAPASQVFRLGSIFANCPYLCQDGNRRVSTAQRAGFWPRIVEQIVRFLRSTFSRYGPFPLINLNGMMLNNRLDVAGINRRGNHDATNMQHVNGKNCDNMNTYKNPKWEPIIALCVGPEKTYARVDDHMTGTYEYRFSILSQRGTHDFSIIRLVKLAASMVAAIAKRGFRVIGVDVHCCRFCIYI